MTEELNGTEQQGIDLAWLSMAVQLPNPTITLGNERKLFIRLHSIDFLQHHTDTKAMDCTELMFKNGNRFRLTVGETAEFWEKMRMVAEVVHRQIEQQKLMQEMQQKQALTDAAKGLKISH